jgi:hypothetical protein
MGGDVKWTDSTEGDYTFQIICFNFLQLRHFDSYALLLSNMYKNDVIGYLVLIVLSSALVY